MRSVPPALATAFESKVTITAAELCRLLPLDPETLRGHIRRGHISFIQTGFGERAPRRAFTLEAVVDFLRGQSRTECLSSSAQVRRSTATTSSGEAAAFLARRAARIGGRNAGSTPPLSGIKEIHAKLLAERQKAREEKWARNEQAAHDLQATPRAKGSKAKAKTRA